MSPSKETEPDKAKADPPVFSGDPDPDLLVVYLWESKAGAQTWSEQVKTDWWCWKFQVSSHIGIRFGNGLFWSKVFKEKSSFSVHFHKYQQLELQLEWIGLDWSGVEDRSLVPSKFS